MQLAFYFDQTRCSTCSTCTVACKDWHMIKPGPLAHRKIYSAKEEGEFPNVTIYPLIYACNHCDDPVCVKVCGSGAITKRKEDGIVLINRSKCIGLNICTEACPYGVPKRADTGVLYNSNQVQEPIREDTWLVDHPAQKCDGCIDRVNVGKIPVCVVGCPQRAIDFGTVEQIKHKYPDAVRATEVKDFPTDITPYTAGGTGPNLFIRPRS